MSIKCVAHDSAFATSFDHSTAYVPCNSLLQNFFFFATDLSIARSIRKGVRGGRGEGRYDVGLYDVGRYATKYTTAAERDRCAPSSMLSDLANWAMASKLIYPCAHGVSHHFPDFYPHPLSILPPIRLGRWYLFYAAFKIDRCEESGYDRYDVDIPAAPMTSHTISMIFTHPLPPSYPCRSTCDISYGWSH